MNAFAKPKKKRLPLQLLLISCGALTALGINGTAESSQVALRSEIRWGFEDGTLRGWTATGNAFASQPTYGNNVSTQRATQKNNQFRQNIEKVGGDYWNGPYPIGIQGNYWIGTYERRPSPHVPWGRVQRDGPTGTLTSPQFVLDHEFVHFLIGGGCDSRSVGVRLQVRFWGWATVQSATGECDENMRRVVFDVSAYRNWTARLVIEDSSSGPWGHINVDDVRISHRSPSSEKKPVWGFADTHNHLGAHLAFGGRILWGDPNDINEAQQPVFDCRGGAHSNDSGFAADRVIAAMEDANFLGRPVRGPLDTGSGPWAPNPHRRTNVREFRWHSLSHQQMYLHWLRRAYDGGLRLMVTEAVNNRTLDFLTASDHQDTPESDMGAVVEQLEFIRNVAQSNAWIEVATSPSHAREIVNDEKLALVLGVEVDSFADCDMDRFPESGSNPFSKTTGCDSSRVTNWLTQLYRDFDVRQVHPIHLTDNPFGGAAVYSDAFNTANWFLNDYFFGIDDGARSGVAWTFDLVQNRIGIENFLGIALAPSEQPTLVPRYNQFNGHVNRRGLRARGRSLIRELKRRGMIIAVDHMSERSLDEVLGTVNPVTRDTIGTPLVASENCHDLTDPDCQALAYPVALTHSGFRTLQFEAADTPAKNKYKSEVGKRFDQVKRIYRIGGIVSPGIVGDTVGVPYVEIQGQDGSNVENTCAGSSRSFAQSFKYLWHTWTTRMGLPETDFALPMGTDLNGLNGSAAPRFGVEGCWGRKRFRQAMRPNYFYADQEGRFDHEQRQMQLATFGVNYDFYNDQPRLHATRLTPGPELSTAVVEPADQASLIPARIEGVRRWDINFDGVAHYGMLPDYLQDLRAVGMSRENLAPIFSSAEAYIRMWEKACSLSDGAVSGFGCETD